MRLGLLLISIGIALSCFTISSSSAHAVDTCTSMGYSVTESTISSSYAFQSNPTLKFKLSGPEIQANRRYSFDLSPTFQSVPSFTANESGVIDFEWVNASVTNRLDSYELYLADGFGPPKCKIAQWEVVPSGESGISCKYVYISQVRFGQQCFAGPNGCLQSGISYTVNARIEKNGQAYNGEDGEVEFRNTAQVAGAGETIVQSPDGNYKRTYSSLIDRTGNFRIDVRIKSALISNPVICTAPLAISDQCGNSCQTTAANLATNNTFGSASPEPYKICEQIDQTQPHLATAYSNCIECVESEINGQPGTEQNPGGLWTAIGCIPRDPTAIVENLLKVGLGMGGGVALLMILAAGFLFSISQGDPKRTGEAKELLTAAITGLLFIIFSVVILQFIGYTVLKIPGFGG